VWTGDGRVFFYNPSQRMSLWERPEELQGRADVEKMVQNPPDTGIFKKIYCTVTLALVSTYFIAKKLWLLLVVLISS